ncbi:MAG: hypothetical protein DBY32_10300 [Phascolarctobacterium sp.]|nr:MAG: hypothetical protein DBY32_10300 [Phascolarctobacterium sp.]
MQPEQMSFERLKRRLTIIFGGIFALVLAVVVLASSAVFAYAVLSNEEKMLVDDVRDEWREYVNSREVPVNPDGIASGERMAVMYDAAGNLILDQLSEYVQADKIKALRSSWPEADGETALLYFKEPDGSRHFYLSARGDNNDFGVLYTFKDISDYYDAAVSGIYFVLLLCLACLTVALLGGYFMAARVIHPMEVLFLREREFTSDASHELRTPLAVLTIGVEALEGDTDSKYSSFASGIIADLKKETVYMSRLLETLLNISRSDAGVIVYDMHRENLTAAARGVYKNMLPLAKQKGLNLQIDTESYVFAKCDIHKIEQLLIILIDNAIKYSESGTIKLEVTSNLHNAVIKVSDEGIGISKEDSQKIFERFFRVDKARSRQNGGFGLGLSIAKKIISAHKGEIYVKPNKPQGTVFVVKLPLAR